MVIALTLPGFNSRFETDVSMAWMSQMTSNVQLIEALGGGWNAAQLPSEKDVARNTNASH